MLKAGGYYVPILPEEQQDRINYILNDCSPICVIVHKDYYKLIGNNKYINLDNENYLNNNKIKLVLYLDKYQI